MFKDRYKKERNGAAHPAPNGAIVPAVQTGEPNPVLAMVAQLPSGVQMFLKTMGFDPVVVLTQIADTMQKLEQAKADVVGRLDLIINKAVGVDAFNHVMTNLALKMEQDQFMQAKRLEVLEKKMEESIAMQRELLKELEAWRKSRRQK